MGGGIGGLLGMRTAGQDYYYLYDGKGNVGAVIDSAQAVVASYRYDIFGRIMVQSGSLEQPFQFSTKRYYPELGLNYYGYRFYSPAIGRWLNRDPLGEAGGINLYGFVQNNPVNLIDPWGLLDMYQTYQYFHGSKPDPNSNIPPGFTWQGSDMVADLGKMVLDQAAQMTAENLAGKYIGPVAGSALKKINFLLGIFDPFPPPAGGPGDTIPKKKDDLPCE